MRPWRSSLSTVSSQELFARPRRDNLGIHGRGPESDLRLDSREVLWRQMFTENFMEPLALTGKRGKLTS